MSNNVVFFGTPKIAANCLQALLDTKVNVVGVVTKVDGKVGRKQTIQFSEVKQLALQNNLKIFQPNKLVDIESELCSLNADLFVVCAYGKIIPESIFNIPKYHTVNVHTSLLPK
jgi:methionyl-tRNA formyltransferase